MICGDSVIAETMYMLRILLKVAAVGFMDDPIQHMQVHLIQIV